MASDPFATAVEDSYLLMAFLSRRSLTMDAGGLEELRRYDDVMTRVQAQVAAGQDVSQTDRAAFQEGFAALTVLARPMTVDGIRSYLRTHYGLSTSDGRVGSEDRPARVAGTVRPLRLAAVRSS